MSDAFVQRRVRGRLGRVRAAVLVVLSLGLVAGLGWLVLASSVLGASDVRVTGLHDLPASRVTEAARVIVGEPLARLDLEAIEDRVEQIPAVDDATVTRDWPDAVHIDVTERVAVAVVAEAGRLHVMDREGVLFGVLDRPPPGLPRVLAQSIRPEQRADAMAEVAGVVTSLATPIARRVDHVELSSIDSIELALRDGTVVRWGSAEESARKAQVLQALLDIDARVYDVSVPEMPTTSDS